MAVGGLGMASGSVGAMAGGVIGATSTGSAGLGGAVCARAITHHRMVQIPTVESETRGIWISPAALTMLCRRRPQPCVPRPRLAHRGRAEVGHKVERKRLGRPGPHVG